MYCKNCGHEISPSQLFCEKCGTKLNLNNLESINEKEIEDDSTKVIEKSEPIHHQEPPIPPDVSFLKEWYYLEGKDKKGPYSDLEIKQLIVSQKITNETYVWKSGMSQWTFLKDTELSNKSNVITTSIDQNQQLFSKVIQLGGKNFILDELICYISGIIAMIGTLLPYYTISVVGYSESINYISRDGIFLVILVVASLICLWINKTKITLGCAIASVILVIVDFTSDAGEAMAGKHDIGAYTVLIFSILLLFGTVLTYIRTNKK